jgi:iron complex transport system substrate-binding protein
MNAKLITAIVVVIVIAASISFAYAEEHKSKSQPSSITVVDDLGRNVTIRLPVTRVVSMDPSNTQMMYAIGAGNLLVADTSYDWWPANSTKLPHISMDNGTASVEQVVSMDPNLVLATTIQTSDFNIVNQLASLNISVLVFEPQNITGIYRDMLTLGNATGHQEGALKEVNFMKSYLHGVESNVTSYLNKTGQSKESLLYMMWSSPIYTAGPGSFIQNVLADAGAYNIASNLNTSYPTIPIEDVVNDSPQAIIVDYNIPGLSNISWFTNGNQSELWNNITAIKTGQVLFFNQTESNWMNEPGPLTIYAVKTVAQFLYPKAFQ